MPEALKTDATLVRGCSASVWVYPVPERRNADLPGRLQRRHHQGHHRAGAGNGARSSGCRSGGYGYRRGAGAFDLKNQLSSNRTQGVPNMIALIKQHAGRISGN
jgi:cysteine desulfuration protein SufE